MAGLTEELVRELAANPGKADLMRPDRKCSGLWFRVRNGQARWYLQWRDDDGRQRRLTLGKYPSMKLAAARAAAKSKGADVEKGGDPHKEKRERREAVKQTFGVVVERYLADRKPHLRERSFEEVERHLRKHAKSFWAKPIKSITVADVADLVDGLAKDTPVAANAVRTSLGSLFAWSMRKGLAGANPVAVTDAPIKPADIERDRVLTDDEMRAIWAQLRDDDHGRVLRLLALLGQRRGEVGGMCWSEIEGLVWTFDPSGSRDRCLNVEGSKEAVWVIPADRAKNEREHAVPLNRQALDVLAGVTPREGRDLIFGLAGPFSGWSRAKAGLDKRIAEARKKAGLEALPDWRLHDFRRTFATNIDENLGVLPFIVESLLNHADPNDTTQKKRNRVAKIYNRSKYLSEKRQALDMWGEHLLAIIEGKKSNVVPLRPGIAA